MFCHLYFGAATREKCMHDITHDIFIYNTPGISAFAETTKENVLRKGRGAIDCEEEEDRGYLMKEQNDYLHNWDGESFASLKKCMQDLTDQVLPQECPPLLRQPKRIETAKAEVLVTVKKKRMKVIWWTKRMTNYTIEMEETLLPWISTCST